MIPIDLQPIWLSLQLAFITTTLLFLVCLPIAWCLSQVNSKIRLPLQALISMPLVLPPTVVGFYLLVTFSPAYFVGRFLHQHLHVDLVFTFSGLVLGSAVFSLPFMLNPILSGLESLPKSLSEAAYVLGKSKWETFLRVSLPNLKPALLYGAALTFAHTMGEFGVVLMIGGKIPGKTRVASMAIYDEVESFHYASANTYALILFVLSFSLLLTLFLVNKKPSDALGMR